MTYKEYKDMSDAQFPHLNLNSMPPGTLTPPECVKRVTQELFLSRAVDSDSPFFYLVLERETRKQLISLRDDGVHLFE